MGWSLSEEDMAVVVMGVVDKGRWVCCGGKERVAMWNGASRVL